MKKIKIDNTDEYIYIDKLKNGFEVYMLPNYNVNNFYITLNTKYGSINTKFKAGGKEYDMPKGIAHFLEHLSFNMPNESVFDHYSKIGSSINAFTTYDLTSYNVSSNSRFKENLEYLIKYVYTPYFTKELFANEKGVILEEVKMYKDNPGTNIVNGVLNNLFVKDERKYLVGGTVKDVKDIKLEDIEVCYDAFYNPSNMFMVITGNFKVEEALAIIKDCMSKLEDIKELDIKKIFPKEPAKVSKDYEEIMMNIDKPKISMGIKISKDCFKSLKLEDFLIKMYLEVLLKVNFGNTSLLVEELKMGNITDDLDYSVLESEEYFVIIFLASSFYPDYLKDKILEKLENLEVEDADLDRIKKVAISDYILLFDSIVSVNNYIIDEIIDNNKFNNNLVPIYRALDIEIAKKILKKINTNNMTIFKVLPKK